MAVQMASLQYSVSKQLCFTGLPASGHPFGLHFIRAVPRCEQETLLLLNPDIHEGLTGAGEGTRDHQSMGGQEGYSTWEKSRGFAELGGHVCKNRHLASQGERELSASSLYTRLLHQPP